jgi:hypothetical protein
MYSGGFDTLLNFKQLLSKKIVSTSPIIIKYPVKLKSHQVKAIARRGFKNAKVICNNLFSWVLLLIYFVQPLIELCLSRNKYYR